MVTLEVKFLSSKEFLNVDVLFIPYQGSTLITRG